MPKKKPAREWIGNWTVVYEWLWNGQPMRSREHDFQVKLPDDDARRRPPNRWYQFNRHVTNHDNGDVQWIDGFDPSGGFVSYRPDQIVAVRPHKEAKKIATRPNRAPARKPGARRSTTNKR